MTLERPSFVVAHVVYSTVPQDNRTGDGAARSPLAVQCVGRSGTACHAAEVK